MVVSLAVHFTLGFIITLPKAHPVRSELKIKESDRKVLSRLQWAIFGLLLIKASFVVLSKLYQPKIGVSPKRSYSMKNLSRCGRKDSTRALSKPRSVATNPGTSLNTGGQGGTCLTGTSADNPASANPDTAISRPQSVLIEPQPGRCMEVTQADSGRRTSKTMLQATSGVR